MLVDGKRVAFGSLNAVGFSGGVDINLIPFPMIDHIDILKDGASAVYGSDAITGVVNFFLIHKFRGLEIGGSYGNTNLGASNDMGEWEAWLKAGTGDNKTDIVVIADFWERTGGLFSRDRDLSANAFQIPLGGIEQPQRDFSWPCWRLPKLPVNPEHIFRPRRASAARREHAAAAFSSERRDFAILQSFPSDAYWHPGGYIMPYSAYIRIYKGGGDYFAFNFAAVTPALPPADRQSFYGSFMRDVCDKYLTVFADFKYVRSFFDASAGSCAVYTRPIQDPRH